MADRPISVTFFSREHTVHLDQGHYIQGKLDKVQGTFMHDPCKVQAAKAWIGRDGLILSCGRRARMGSGTLYREE